MMVLGVIHLTPLGESGPLPANGSLYTSVVLYKYSFRIAQKSE